MRIIKQPTGGGIRGFLISMIILSEYFSSCATAVSAVQKDGVTVWSNGLIPMPGTG
jgi:hypothetical protein